MPLPEKPLPKELGYVTTPTYTFSTWTRPDRTTRVPPEPARAGAWAVCCGIREMVGPFTASLPPLPAAATAPGHLILDLPWGFALSSPHLREPGSLVLTQHPCPEYWDDLWDLGAQALLVGTPDPARLQSAVQALGAGRRWRDTPPMQSVLRPRERLMLRLVALGWTNERIGLHLDWSDKTVRNKLSGLFAALGVEDRKEAALYYWGLLDRVVPGAARFA